MMQNKTIGNAMYVIQDMPEEIQSLSLTEDHMRMRVSWAQRKDNCGRSALSRAI